MEITTLTQITDRFVGSFGSRRTVGGLDRTHPIPPLAADPGTNQERRGYGYEPAKLHDHGLAAARLREYVVGEQRLRPEVQQRPGYPLEHPHPKGLLHNPAFSQVVAAPGRRTIYTAGQVSIDERGALVGAGDLAAQTAQALRNVGLALTAVGASFTGILKITTYVVNYKPEYRAIIGKARAPFFANGTLPASTLVGVAALALREWLVDIEAVAIVD